MQYLLSNQALELAGAFGVAIDCDHFDVDCSNLQRVATSSTAWGEHVKTVRGTGICEVSAEQLRIRAVPNHVTAPWTRTTARIPLPRVERLPPTDINTSAARPRQDAGLQFPDFWIRGTTLRCGQSCPARKRLIRAALQQIMPRHRHPSSIEYTRETVANSH